ncbi:DUF3300 domain-containing protein [Bradyrhizobium tropiciagri]|uniref:DUF3300 domain-containing protein n=1 Tax=Bradyrhizobium tropiciagri TaxID=312253 RepID=UPI001BAAFDFA|nr:DUF3300 domain-containing protein [Bradyrhizobium tropiciagri]MBR0900186.1 DUF3300 domain-containing protein [Bradyrhizobium tropiciagri]
MVRWGKTLLAVVLVSMTSVAALAQTADKPPAQTSQPVQANQPAAAAAQPADQLLKPEQLEALVAPIALYPDSLLANVLAASTYPLEVVQADRWLKERKNLKGDALKTEVDKQAWDDSVKALASTADVLAMMSDKVDWTKNLGDAVLAQQADVMDAIQRLRSKAQANNKLVTTKQQKVSVQTQENKQVIVIEQTDPNTIYVPYYDPATVYGAWPYAAYPPYYFGYPSYIGAGVVAAGLAFGAGWAIGRWGNYWGGGCNWGNRNVYVNHRTTNIANGWQHNSAHRQGVRYNNSSVQQRFGGTNNRAGVSDRMNYRGRDGQQVLNPGDRQGADRGGDRAGDRGGDRAGDRGGDRAGDRAGDRGGDRGGDRAGDRAKGGDRAGAGNKAKGGGDRANAANRGSAGNRAAAANRGGGGNRGGAMNVSSGRAASAASARGRSSMASMPRGGGGASFAGRGGGGFSGGGGGGFRGGGGGGGGFRGGGGGGRRSDIALKHDIELLGYLANGLGYYRFSYLGSSKAYVGVMAQEVEQVMPAAVTRGADGYLRVYYDRLGIKFRSYHDWLAAGAKIPSSSEASR